MHHITSLYKCLLIARKEKGARTKVVGMSLLKRLMTIPKERANLLNSSMANSRMAN